MGKKEGKVVYVLDLFHLLETKFGHDRVENMSLEKIMELKDDTALLIKGKISPKDFETKWEI